MTTVQLSMRLNRDELRQALVLLQQTLAERTAAPLAAAPTSAAASGLPPAQPSPPISRIHAVTQTFATDQSAHEGRVVPSIVHLPAIGTSDFGALVSLSENTVNVWQCEADRITLAQSVALDAPAAIGASLETPATTLLLALPKSVLVAVPTNAPAVGTGLLQVSYAVPIPGLSQLAPLGPTVLDGSWVAGSINNSVTLFSVSAQSGSHDSAHDLGAHSTSITCVRRCGHSNVIASGDAGGALHVWDPRVSGPVTIFPRTHTLPVTCVEGIDNVHMASGSADGRLLVWDLRNPSTVYVNHTIDGKPILNMRVHPELPLACASTLKGPYCFSTSTYEPLIAAGTVKKPCPDLAWNPTLRTRGGSTCVFYASTLNGALHQYEAVFSR